MSTTASETEPEAEAPAPVPVVQVEHLGLLGPEGRVFADVSLTVPPSRVTLLVGRSGSGRSSLLLALCGRMRGTTGTVRRHGHPVRSGRELRALRHATSVARVATFVVPEARLTVAESITERALLDGVRPARAEESFAAAESLLDIHLDRTALVEHLPAYEVTALSVALALVRPAELVVLDDLDADLDLSDQRRLVGGLLRLAATGPAVLASTTEPRSAHPDVLLVALDPPQEDH